PAIRSCRYCSSIIGLPITKTFGSYGEQSRAYSSTVSRRWDRLLCLFQSASLVVLSWVSFRLLLSSQSSASFRSASLSVQQASELRTPSENQRKEFCEERLFIGGRSS